MRRAEAARRHRRAVVIIAALAGILVVLLASVAPWAKGQYEARGIDPSPMAEAIFRVGAAVEENVWLIVLLVAALIGLLWTSFGMLDRTHPPGSDA